MSGDTGYIRNLLDLLQVATDVADIFYIMDFDVDFGLEDAVLCLDGEFIDVHIELLGKDSGNLIEYAHMVDAFDAYGGGEIEALVGVPLGREYAVAVCRFQAVGLRTTALVDCDAVVLVDISEDIVTWDGVTTRTDNVVPDGFLVEKECFLAVNLGSGGGMEYEAIPFGFVSCPELEIATPFLVASFLVA